MFYYLNGTVAHIGPYLAVINSGGVGDASRPTNYTLSRLPNGTQRNPSAHPHVRAGTIDL